MKPRSETSAAQTSPTFLSQWFNPRVVNNQSDALPSIRPIAAFGRIGGNVAKTLFKTRLSVAQPNRADRKSTRLNSSHGYISYAVFCLKKKKKIHTLYIL